MNGRVINSPALDVLPTDTLTINGGASAVICGGVQTANATVYLIDTVLMPPM